MSTLTLATEEEKQAAAGKPVTRRAPEGDASGFVLSPGSTKADNAAKEPPSTKTDDAPVAAAEGDKTVLAETVRKTPPIPVAKRPGLSEDKTFRFTPDEPPATDGVRRADSARPADTDALRLATAAAAAPKSEPDPVIASAPAETTFKLIPSDAPDKTGVVDKDADVATRGVSRAPEDPPTRPANDPAVKTDESGDKAPVFKLAVDETASAAKPDPKPAVKTAVVTKPAPKDEDKTFKLVPGEKTAVRSTPSRTGASAGKLRLPYVQAGLFGVAENATKLVARLKARGIPATAKSLVANGKTFSRVIAGPFNDSTTRDKARSVIRSMGMRDARPVRR